MQHNRFDAGARAGTTEETTQSVQPTELSGHPYIWDDRDASIVPRTRVFSPGARASRPPFDPTVQEGACSSAPGAQPSRPPFDLRRDPVNTRLQSWLSDDLAHRLLQSLPAMEMPPAVAESRSHADKQSQLAVAQRGLEQLADEKMPAAMSTAFKSDINRFANRAARQKLSFNQQEQVYWQMARLLGGADPPAQDGRIGWRHVLSKQIICYAADPTTIDQGGHNTCGAAALEAQMFARDPADAAQLIADVFLTGKFQPRDGSKAVAPDSSLTYPDWEAMQTREPDGLRSYASQLFQGAAISMIYPGYRQVVEYASKHLNGPRRLKEVIVEVKNSPHGQEIVQKDFDGLYPFQIAQMNGKITGNRNPLAIIERRDVHPFDGMIHVGSEKELADRLNGLNRANRLPATFFVNTDHEPFWTDGRHGQYRTAGGGHVVGGSEPQPAKPVVVSIDNQWGKESDHKSIPVQELYLSLYSFFTLGLNRDLQRAIEKNRKEGRVNTVLELELARQERVAGVTSSEQYAKSLEKIMNDFDKRRDQGRVSLDEQHRVLNTLQQTSNHRTYMQLDEIRKRWQRRMSPHLKPARFTLSSFLSRSEVPPRL